MGLKKFLNVLLAISALAQLVSCDRDRPEVETTKDRAVAASKAIGDKIAAALIEYQKDTGYFPRDLNALVPNYLPRIDPPLYGSPSWHYAVNPDRKGFVIRFGGPVGSAWIYWRTQVPQWVTDTG